jgi:uncharacterized protein YbjQ (UPF0145 family)
MFELILGGGVSVVALVMGLLVGTRTERRHLRSLEQRETAYREVMLVTNMRRMPERWEGSRPTLVQGQAVITSDYFKTFVAGLIKLVGGELETLEPLVDRARREATLRMLDEARRAGCNVVWNLRTDYSTIVRGMGTRKGIAAAEVLVYGTAVRIEQNAPAPSGPPASTRA